MSIKLKEDEVLVTCNYKDLKVLGKGDTWVVEESEFNQDTQVGEVILRPLGWRDI